MKIGDYVRTKNDKIFKWEETMTTEKFANEVGYDGRYIYINKDEIKEILEDIKDMNNYSNFIDSQYGGENYYYLLEKEESKHLLDYITTLQEENERLNNIIKEVRDFTKIGSMTYKHILGDFEVIEVESLLKILDKENKQ